MSRVLRLVLILAAAAIGLAINQLCFKDEGDAAEDASTASVAAVRSIADAEANYGLAQDVASAAPNTDAFRPAGP